jgi:hypothetical protein
MIFKINSYYVHCLVFIMAGHCVCSLLGSNWKFIDSLVQIDFGAWFRDLATLCGVCGRWIATWTGLSPSTSAFISQHHYATAPYSYSSSLLPVIEGQTVEARGHTQRSDALSEFGKHQGESTYIHTHIYIYVCVCVSVCVCFKYNRATHENFQSSKICPAGNKCVSRTRHTFFFYYSFFHLPFVFKI